MSNYYLKFGADTSKGVLDSGISLTTGTLLEVSLILPSTPPAGEFAIVTNTAGTDAIMLNSTLGTENRCGVKIGGTYYSDGSDTSEYWDGAEHTILVSRAGSTFNFYFDSDPTPFSFSAASTTMTANNVFYDPVSGDSAECYVSDMTIGTSTYPVTSSTSDIWEDTSVGANDITLTATELAKVGNWEWVGEWVDISRTYSTQNGIVSERRVEGTRARNVCGLPMETAELKNLGDTSTAVTALNRNVLSTLSPPPGEDITCESDNFAPVPGTGFFRQSQQWVYWRNT